MNIDCLAEKFCSLFPNVRYHVPMDVPDCECMNIKYVDYSYVHEIELFHKLSLLDAKQYPDDKYVLNIRELTTYITNRDPARDWW